jgi:hypothetical protein
VTIEWKKPDELRVPYGENGFLVFGPGLPSEGAAVRVVFSNQAPCCTLQIANLPAGSQSWLIVPYWSGAGSQYQRAFDVSTGLRVTANVAPWSSTPGPPPTGIVLQAIQASNVINATCSVTIKVTWAPVPGATGYVVHNESGPLGSPSPFTTFSFNYRQENMRLSDLGKAAVLAPISDYANAPQFRRGVQVKVAAIFPDRADGVSAFVPLTFSTFPCWDGRNFPSDP